MTKTRGVLFGIGGFLVFIAVLGMLISLTWGFRWFTADIRGAISAREQIKARGEYRIDRYDHFFDMCATVQTHEASIKAQEARLASADEDAAQRVMANIAGLKAQRARLINQYNADARKSYTSGQFRDSSLPYHLDVNVENTSCD